MVNAANILGIVMSDHELAARLATDAGRLLLGVREEFADADASERKAAGD